MILGGSYYGLDVAETVKPVQKYGGNLNCGTFMYETLYYGYSQIAEVVLGLRTLSAYMKFLATSVSESNLLNTAVKVYN